MMQPISKIYNEQYKYFDYTSTGIFIISHKYEILLWNSNLENWTLYKSDELIGKKLTNYFPDFNDSLYKKLLNNVFNEGMTTVFSSILHSTLFKTKYNKNQKLHTTVIPIPGTNTKTYHALFSIEDQTNLTELIAKNHNLNNQLLSINNELENRIIERTKEIENTKKRLSHILNSAPSTIILINTELNIILVNNEGLNYFESDSYSWQNKKICEFIKCQLWADRNCSKEHEPCEKCQIGQLITDTIKNSSTNYKVECGLTRKTKNNNIVNSTLLVSTTKISSDNDSNILVVMDDITERKQIETELINAKNKAIESDRLKSSFLANMSHEIRTPLNGIVGMSDLIANSELSKDNKVEYAKIISESSDDLLHHIDSIIDISKLESNQLNLYSNNIDINPLLDKVYHSTIEKNKNKNIELVLSKGILNKPCLINTDQIRLTQVLNNLLLNALKFTTKGHIEFGYIPYEKNIKFYVKDTGKGIPEHMHDLIFKPFRQVRDETMEIYRGSGLGLAISKKLVEVLGGTIWLESEIDKGSVFYFTLPY